MRKIKFLNSGKVMTVENNVAHGFIERKLAVIWKGLDEAPKDKMMTRKRKIKVNVK